MTRHEAIGAACAAALCDSHSRDPEQKVGRQDVIENPRGTFKAVPPNSGYLAYHLRVIVTASIDPRTMFGIVMVNAVDGLEPF